MNPEPHIENLTPFKPGESGNPKGAPKGMHLTTILRKVLEGEIEVKDLETGQYRKMTKAELVMIALVKEAVQGNVKAAREILDRLDGKVPQKIGLTGVDGGALIPPQIIFAPISPRQDITPPQDPPAK